MKYLSFGQLKERVGGYLNGRSISELSSFFVKLLLLGSVLTIGTYMLTNHLISHNQKVFTDEVLPILTVQRNIEVDLVDYAMLEASIRQDEAGQIYGRSIRRLNSRSIHNLQVLNNLVQGSPSLLAIKSRLDTHSRMLVSRIKSIDSLQNNYLLNKEKLKGFKREAQEAVEQLIILREGFSGKVTLSDVLRQRSNLEGGHELFHANLVLGLKLSELTNNVSILMYVDNIDQLRNMNSHQISENLQQVKKSLKSLSYAHELTPALALDVDKMLGNLQMVETRLSNKAALTQLLKTQFKSEASLALGSRTFRGLLVSMQNELADMYLISEMMVNNSIVKNEEFSFISALFLLILLVVFVVVLTVFIIVVARQVEQPVTQLSNTMKRLIQGDLSARLTLDNNTFKEFQGVWGDFNDFVGNNEKVIQEQEMIIDNADIGIAWLRDRQYVRVNNKILSMFDFTSDNFVGQNSLFLYPNTGEYYILGEEAYPLLSRGEVYTTEQRLMRSDGSVFWCKLTGKSMGLSEKKDSIWLFEDVTERKLAEDKLYNLANYDALTMLPNRGLFNIYLDEAIVKSRRKGVEFALFFIDLDRFKHINDSWGHEAGDAVLKEIAKRVASVVRESDIVARLGGDEFTLIVDDVQDKNGIEKVANMVLGELSRVISHQGKELFVGGSIGISRFPLDARSRDGLLNCADSAMYIAKQSGRNGFCFYSSEIGVSGEKFAELSQSLKKAVEHNEFELYYQPKINMLTRELVGLEALIRWNKPGKGLVSPFEFIPVLEESGLMVEVGEWVVFEACRAIKTWLELGYNPGKVAINLSERQFGNNKLLDTIKRALDEADISADRIELEITESLMMSDTELTVNTLKQIKKMGIDIAMDDFGTGYSSLAYLKRYPIDILKIDRAFVKDVTDDKNDAAIVEAIIALAKQLKLKVVAEGIETEAQYDFLKACGCEVGQGYLFSKPVDFDGVLALLEKGVSLDISGG